MNCADARHLILSVDSNALRDRTDPVLRHHLDGCPECARAAGLVVADMGRLRAALADRSVVAARSRRAPRRVAMTLVPVALAAELALFAFIPGRDQAPPRQVVVESRKPDSASRRDTMPNWKDSVAALLGHVLPTGRVQLASFDTADRKSAAIWYMKPDTL